MSRYKVRLVPAGAIPQDTNLGIHLQRIPSSENPLAASQSPAVPTCSDVCAGWTVTVNGDPSTGDLHTFDDAAVEIVVTNLATLCPGHCIDWSIRSLFDQTGIFSDFSISASDCNSVTISATAHSASYNGLIFGLWATIDGVPFCENLIFRGQTGTSCTRDTVTAYYSLLDGSTPPDATAILAGATLDSTFPNAAFTLDFVPTNDPIEPCADNIYATLGFAGGDAGAYGDFTVDSFITIGSASPGVRLSASGANDYTGITVTISPFWTADGTTFDDGIGGGPIIVSCA